MVPVQIARPTASPAVAAHRESRIAWYRTTFAWAMAGSLLMVAALPPWNCWPLAWVAPVPWLMLARRTALIGWRPYRAIWLAGFAFWMSVLHWLRLPHWATSIGWVAVSFYLAFYILLFVALLRVAVHRIHVPLVVAAPIVWVGLELVKGHVLGGFTMGSLEHTQTAWLEIIQPADLIGGYGVSGIIMFVAACLARMLPCDGRRFAIWPVAPLAAAMAATLVYGHFRLGEMPAGPTARVALIQGSIDTTIKSDPKQIDKIWDDYMRLTVQAVREAANLRPARPLDLIVWPETMFRYPLLSFDDDFEIPSQRDKQAVIAETREAIAKTTNSLADIARHCHAALLFGIDRQHWQAMDRGDHYNSAQFVAADGSLLACYDKMHPVMFGEYVPLAEYFPFLYRLTPLSGGLKAGDKPVGQKIDGVRFCPSICYESVIPHLIRRQVRDLREQGAEPDVLVNVTNDGWFWGSSELKLHLQCGVLRAVECRKPLLIAANTGISAWIDANGRVVQQAPRRQDAVIIADVQADGRRSFYLAHGDWLAGACLLACLGLTAIGLRDYRRRKRARLEADGSLC
jgi:apolipoprotein N-acyltransferase